MARVSTALVLIAFFVVFPSMVLATQYVVGDDLGWNGDADYEGWVADKTFFVGDVLVFNYVATDHNVVIATNGDNYDNCVASPNFGVYDSGNDAITLNEAGTYYFLCSYHCDYLQQKVMVTVN
ncbi:putative cupredoxin [Rosa chinensis]|uniref:Putative cupredoxin n=1 Tax=Rosa chinensis TaxID=74649 RepID=A0A2P6SGJ0_ROSCH|nr:blue copper protein 1a [Rosa chinensis]PRQ57779.1 putative cupredoxin [Rosa chinensis]